MGATQVYEYSGGCVPLRSRFRLHGFAHFRSLKESKLESWENLIAQPHSVFIIIWPVGALDKHHFTAVVDRSDPNLPRVHVIQAQHGRRPTPQLLFPAPPANLQADFVKRCLNQANIDQLRFRKVCESRKDKAKTAKSGAKRFQAALKRRTKKKKPKLKQFV